MNGAGPVAALAFTPDSTELLSAHAKEGRLRRWKVSDSKLVTSFDVGPVSLVATAFDKRASLLAVSEGKTPGVSQAGYTIELKGTYIWDTQTGKLKSRLKTASFSDIDFSPDGQWLAGVRGTGLDFADIAEARVVAGKGFGDFRSPSEINNYDTVAFDAAGDYVAIASENGGIRLRRWSGKEILDGIDLVDAVTELPAWHTQPVSLPLAIAFDPARRWLAAVRSESLEIYDLSKHQLSFSATVAQGPSAALAFDPLGDLLAVGTEGGWQVWSVRDKKVLAQKPGTPVYAIAFSPDGRLLVAGDSSGEIHIWGVPGK